MTADDEHPDGTAETPTEPARPLLRVVRGDPTPEELAALVAVVAASGAPAQAQQPGPASLWSAPRHRLPAPVHPGPGAWRASGLPR